MLTLSYQEEGVLLSYLFFPPEGFGVCVCYDCALLELRGDAFCSADWINNDSIFIIYS